MYYCRKLIKEGQHYFYCQRFKNKFRYLLWKKIREPKIKARYHPSYLDKLKDIDDSDEEAMDTILEKW